MKYRGEQRNKVIAKRFSFSNHFLSVTYVHRKKNQLNLSHETIKYLTRLWNDISVFNISFIKSVSRFIDFRWGWPLTNSKLLVFFPRNNSQEYEFANHSPSCFYIDFSLCSAVNSVLNAIDQEYFNENLCTECQLSFI